MVDPNDGLKRDRATLAFGDSTELVTIFASPVTFVHFHRKTLFGSCFEAVLIYG